MRILLALLVLAACQSGEGDALTVPVDDTVTTTGNTETTGPTTLSCGLGWDETTLDWDCPTCGFSPDFFTFSAVVAWYDEPYNLFSGFNAGPKVWSYSYVTFTLHDRLDNCYIRMFLDGEEPSSPWVESDERMLTGVTIHSDNTTLDVDCGTGFGEWPQDAVDYIISHEWGLALGPYHEDLDSVREAYRDMLGYLADSLVGGYLYQSGNACGVGAYGTGVDNTQTRTQDIIQPEDVVTSVPNGVYTVVSTPLFDFPLFGF